jgi:hypothetical protein
VPEQPPRDEDEELTGPGYLLREVDGRLHALRGQVAAFGDSLAFQVLDHVRGQRRWWSRLEVALDAVLEPAGEGAPLQTRTEDISAGGARVVWEPGTPVAPAYAVRLSGGGLAEEVTAQATPARATATSLSLRFTDIDAAGRAAIAQLVVAGLRERLRRGVPLTA